MRAARMHTEELVLNRRERPALQAMRAARMHKAEKALNAMEGIDSTNKEVGQRGGGGDHCSASPAAALHRPFPATVSPATTATTTNATAAAAQPPQHQFANKRRVNRRSSELFRAVSLRTETVVARRGSIGRSSAGLRQRAATMPPALELWAQSSGMIISEEEEEETDDNDDEDAEHAAEDLAAGADSTASIPTRRKSAPLFRSVSLGSKAAARARQLRFGKALGVSTLTLRTDRDSMANASG